MFTSGEKTFTIFDIFFIILLSLIIIQIILSAVLRYKLKSYYENYSFENEDLPLIALGIITFTRETEKPEYDPISNLGSAGELILDCYSGHCRRKKKWSESSRVCSLDEDGEEICGEVFIDKKIDIDIIDHKCSFECFELKEKTCSNCTTFSDYISSKGNCIRNTNDDYSDGKYCLSDNIINFWKGKIYEAYDYNYSYIKNAVLKNEECPPGKKDCGILDDNGNRLCRELHYNCPINIISEEKLNNSNYSFTVGNKTFYYGYINDKNRKIISGLYVDTDIYPNKKESIILDTYTISGVLEENKILYKGVDLGFDPYTDKDIDKKGKSYLKIRYNENIDLASLRKKYFNKEKNRKRLNKLYSGNFKSFNILGIVIYSILFALYVKNMIIAFCRKSNNEVKISKNQKKFEGCFFLLTYLCLILSLLPLIKSCTFVRGLNKTDLSSLKIINILFIVFGFLLFGISIVFTIIFCIKKREDLSDQEDIKSVPDTSTTIKNYDSKINIKNKI